MPKADKRARQKERRAAIVAAQRAAARRTNFIRLGVIFVLLAGLIGFALFTGGEDGGGGDEESGGGPAACGAEAPAEADPKQYDSPSEMTLEDGVDYRAVMETSCGTIEMDLLEEDTPETVNNFVFLAREGYYDGLTFHRVEQNQVVQGGDPNGDGSGGPGYAIPDELPKSKKEYTFGTVGMANSGPDTGGSQFFFVVRDPNPQGGFDPAGYPPAYSIFAKVDPEDSESVSTLTKIGEVPVGPGPDPAAPPTVPQVPVYIESVEIEEA
jgi:cyclophilin family peptidyl-prolyl cis-trans isomerase